MISKLFSAVAVTVALLAGAVAPTTAASITGVLVDMATWTVGVDSEMRPMILYPFMRTAAQLLASSADGYVFVTFSEDTGIYSVYANLTSESDITQVTNFLSLQDSTALNMEITVSDATKITPTATSSAWTLSGLNLQPFGVNASLCDYETAMACGARVIATAYAIMTGGDGWDNCATVGVADIKTCFAPPTGTGCLALLVNSMASVMNYCQTAISTVALICADGTEGAEALCAYVNSMKPSGVASATAVVSADSDGTVNSLSNTGGSSAVTAARAGVAAAITAAAAAASLLL